MEKLITAKGIGRDIVLNNDSIEIIQHRGCLNLLNPGFSDRIKINLKDIQGIEFKGIAEDEAGYIRIIENKADSDRESLIINFLNTETEGDFKTIHTRIKQEIHKIRNPHQAECTNMLRFDELEKLREKRENGEISEDEYEKQKKDYLGI